MQFFKAISGALYPVSSIRRIGKPQEVTYSSGRKGMVHQVRLVDEEEVEISEEQFTQIQDQPTHVLAALPGTSVIDYDKESGEALRTAVIGWAISSDGAVEPITLEGVADGSPNANHDIELHNGTITRPYIQWWETFEAWKADKEKEPQRD